jgi:hypothetical protein
MERKLPSAHWKFGNETMPVLPVQNRGWCHAGGPCGTCTSDTDAKTKADFFAQQIAIDLDGDDEARCVIVVNENGTEIHKVSVKP